MHAQAAKKVEDRMTDRQMPDLDKAIAVGGNVEIDVAETAQGVISRKPAEGNDLGYDQVFAKQIEMHGRPGDLVIAISSSGRSANILNAVKAARAAKSAVVTFSGFAADNPLRSLGNINFYIASDRYGFVEIGHLTICHAILDFLCGKHANPCHALASQHARPIAQW